MPLKVHQQLIIFVFHICMAVGAFLIVKGYGSEFGWWTIDAASSWARLSEWAGSVIAVFGCLLVAASIYIEKWLHSRWRPADWISYYLFAPIVVASAAFTLGWMAYTHRILVDVVNGYAVLGLTGELASGI